MAKKRPRAPLPQVSRCFAHLVSLQDPGYTAQVVSQSHLCTSTMPFNFHAIQVLDLKAEDHPSIDVHNGQLVLTASRGDEMIRITAPLQGVLSSVHHTTVRKPRLSRRGISIGGGEKRQGELNKMAKLTEEDVRAIRTALKDPKFVKGYRNMQQLCQELGEAYNVHFVTIRNVITNVSWKHVQV